MKEAITILEAEIAKLLKKRSELLVEYYVVDKSISEKDTIHKTASFIHEHRAELTKVLGILRAIPQ